MQTELEQFILCGNIIQSDNTVKRQEKICSKIAKKWLNCLGYKEKNL